MLKSRLPVITVQMAARIDAALGVAAEGIALDARARVPVGPPDVHLRDKIHVERDGPMEYMVVAGDDDAFYGHMVEFGTSHSPPRPFLVPAAEGGRAEALALVRAAMRGL